MNQGGFRRIAVLSGAFFLVWGVTRYFLPLVAPFLLGWIFAAAAEPMTQFLHSRVRLHRSLAAGVSVSLVLLVLVGVVCLAGALCYRELAGLAVSAPEYAEALGQRATEIQDWALRIAGSAPGGLGNFLSRGLSDLFAGGGVLLEKLTSGAISAAGNVAGKIPGGALMLGTAVISAYMISGQYPALKRRIMESGTVYRKWMPMARNISETAGLWLKAQLKLTGVTFGIVGAGFLILRVEHWLLWAMVTAVVDAIPLLGTGTVLIPMALLSFFWGEQVRAIGLLGLYVTAMLTRSALEPRLVGKQLGMTPLSTLMALYAGFKIWGVPGMILSPLLAVTVMQLISRAD